jgi:transposase
VDALGNPVRFILTAGQVNDIVQAENLINGFSLDKLLGDRGFDSDRFRGCIAHAGAEAVIPSTRSRSRAPVRQAHLQGTQSGRAVLQQDPAISPYRHTLGEDCALLRGHPIPPRRRHLAAVNVNRT